MNSPIIYWFRQDLRLSDLPALLAASATGRPVVACYILDDEAPGEWAIGGASRWWLHYSLTSLQIDLNRIGGRLVLRSGPTVGVLGSLVAETGATAIYCSRQYEPWAAALENTAHDFLQKRAIDLKRFPGSLLFEPESIKNQSGLPFKVFTPFWRACRRQGVDVPRAEPENTVWHTGPVVSEQLDEWALLPQRPNWAEGFESLWQPGKAGAESRINDFLKVGIQNYSEGRDHPALEATTRSSPHIHFGEISPREIWQTAMHALHEQSAQQDQVDKFLSELGWREFSYHLLSHFPHLPEAPFKTQFTAFPWLGTPAALTAWQRGQTGYPIVDAGMRELWNTGYMHNRVRMIVASFLTKHLLIHWRAGANWFWDTLLDADLASNSSSWQWVAGSGADASPYFRIFNPIIQGEKFDKQGDYVRQWVPEIGGLPNKYLHQPWEASAEILSAAGISLGEDYPHPIVDHKEARAAALSAYGSITGVQT